jgi:hypothetical protein
VDALVKSSSGKETRTSFDIRALDAQEKRKNALKGLGICWLISIVTIPLPPIHWVTVPFFFFFGFYWAWRKLREGTYSEAFSFPCPGCQQTVQVAARPLAPQWEAVCPNCKYSLKIATQA